MTEPNSRAHLPMIQFGPHFADARLDVRVDDFRDLEKLHPRLAVGIDGGDLERVGINACTTPSRSAFNCILSDPALWCCDLITAYRPP